ncbi:DMT family transporter [Sciscionella sediminilitoris]|uniref:DMT family transporter n=1 Tax=Sciscionella sediminilitoris TaxID=1445613 RepID=UPI0004DEFE27|nr:SMR family transporter [Sciscionella sp. SE31]
MAYLLLIGAILAETTGTLATRYTDGFTRILPSAIVVIGVLGAYVLLSLSLKHGMSLGVAYGIWAAAGVAIVAVIGATVFHEPLSFVQGIGIALVIGGVLALELGRA